MVSKEILRITTIGNVDSGKSTLLGRILYETRCVYEDQLDAIRKISEKKGEDLDLSLLLDGLASEREQGITIDVAYRYFETDKRKFIVADNPGHEQYTRNMVTGASVSDVALVMVDAKDGLTEQSKRHIFISSLLQIKHLFIIINKIDLVDYSEERYNAIIEQYNTFANKLEFSNVRFVPVSALVGDNVVLPSTNTPWYNQPPLLAQLEDNDFRVNTNQVDFRLPIQSALRTKDFRGYIGTIASGTVTEGEDVTILPSKETTKIKTIQGDRAVTITLEDEVDVSRGSMIVRRDNLPSISNNIDCYVCVFSDDGINPNDRYILKHTTQTTSAYIDTILYEINVNDLHRDNTDQLKRNAIGRVKISTMDSIFFDSYDHNKTTGSFVLIDPNTFETVAAGIIKKDSSSDNIFYEKMICQNMRERKQGHTTGVFWLTGLSGSGKTTIARNVEKDLFQRNYQVVILDGDNVRHGLCSDLGFAPEDRTENIRRIAEVAKILRQSGFVVICSFISPLQAHRDMVREIIGDGFHEVYVECGIDECIRRDVKGLYAKAISGEIPNFTGISAPYEHPIESEFVINTDNMSIDDATLTLKTYITDNTKLFL